MQTIRESIQITRTARATHVVHHAFATLVALTVVLQVSACQTTRAKPEPVQIDLADSRIVLPDALLEQDWFSIEKVELLEEGSFRWDGVFFNAGVISYQRYYKGGFKRVNESNFNELVSDNFENAKFVGETKTADISIGKVYYNDFRYQGDTCVAMLGNQGERLFLRGGPGTQGIVRGIYCENGNVENLDDGVFKWMKQVQLTDG